MTKCCIIILNLNTTINHSFQKHNLEQNLKTVQKCMGKTVID